MVATPPLRTVTSAVRGARRLPASSGASIVAMPAPAAAAAMVAAITGQQHAAVRPRRRYAARMSRTRAVVDLRDLFPSRRRWAPASTAASTTPRGVGSGAASLCGLRRAGGRRGVSRRRSRRAPRPSLVASPPSLVGGAVPRAEPAGRARFRAARWRLPRPRLPRGVSLAPGSARLARRRNITVTSAAMTNTTTGTTQRVRGRLRLMRAGTRANVAGRGRGTPRAAPCLRLRSMRPAPSRRA